MLWTHCNNDDDGDDDDDNNNNNNNNNNAIQLSLGGTSPYSSTDKTNKNKYI